MKQTPENPFGQFIVKRIADQHIPRSQIALKMGYKSVAKALRRLDQTIESGMADRDFLHRISQGLDIPAAVMNEQIDLMNLYLEKKRQERIAAERQSFEPYILAICARQIPTPIFVGCMTAGMRKHRINKELLALPHTELLAQVGSEIQAHFLKCNGAVPAFGDIIGYVLHRNYDEVRGDMLCFNTDGTLTEDRFEGLSVVLMRGSLSVGGRDILPLLRVEAL